MPSLPSHHQTHLVPRVITDAVKDLVMTDRGCGPCLDMTDRGCGPGRVMTYDIMLYDIIAAPGCWTAAATQLRASGGDPVAGLRWRPCCGPAAATRLRTGGGDPAAGQRRRPGCGVAVAIRT
jgi:hypothetical protein